MCASLLPYFFSPVARRLQACLLLPSLSRRESFSDQALTTHVISSRARTHRYMLEEVCHGEHFIEQLGQERGAVYTELRGEVLGRQ